MKPVALLILVALAAPLAVAAQERSAVDQPAAPPDGGLLTPLDQARRIAVSGDRAEAIRLYDALLETNPGDVDARLGRGRTLAWMGQWDAAGADLVQVTRDSPGYGDAWSALGDMYLWSDRPMQAVEAYSQWAQLQPDRPAPLLARSRAHRAAGEPALATVDLDTAAARGADPGVVERARVALVPRISNPEAVAPAGFRWQLQAEAGRTAFSGSRADWDDHALVLRHYMPRASVAVEALQTHRFGKSDQAWAIDAYVDAWPRAYANLRYQAAPGYDLFPGHSWRVELFQGVGKGWELSGAVNQLRFRSSTVDLYSVGVGRYVGNFYLRGRARWVDGSDSVGVTGQVRYYYAGNGDDYFEVSAGSGRSREERFGAMVNDVNSSVGLAYVRYLTRNVGLKLSAGYSDDSPDETRVSGTLYYRW